MSGPAKVEVAGVQTRLPLQIPSFENHLVREVPEPKGPGVSASGPSSSLADNPAVARAL